MFSYFHSSLSLNNSLDDVSGIIHVQMTSPHTFSFTKSNRLVSISRFSKFTSAIANGSELVKITDSRFIPKQVLYTPADLVTGNSDVFLKGYIEIKTNGSVVWHGSTIPTTYGYLFSAKYFV